MTPSSGNPVGQDAKQWIDLFRPVDKNPSLKQTKHVQSWVNDTVPFAQKTSEEKQVQEKTRPLLSSEDSTRICTWIDDVQKAKK